MIVRDGKNIAVFRYTDGSKHECEVDAKQEYRRYESPLVHHRAMLGPPFVIPS